MKSKWSEKEEEIQASWEENSIFEKSLKKNEGNKHFVFYDGPPFATGLPHYGHLLASIIKDTIPRYQTMRGKYVRRVWGWDCHGLPVETLIEEELGLKHKKDIEELGVGKFNKAARDSVMRYDTEWKKIIPRIGRWIDMEGGYKTMDWQYTESVWWGFKELYEKDLIFKGHKAMHICPRCETTLSSTEVTDGYKDITDISVTAKFELVDPIRTNTERQADGTGDSKEATSNGTGEPKTYILAWTTTPWTLPGNVALAVGENIEYVKASVIESFEQIPEGGEIPKKEKTEIVIVAKNIIEPYKSKSGENYIWGGVLLIPIETIKGKDLIGKSYKPVFDYYSKDENLKNRENGWKIYAGDFVTTESGTGIVHIAPAFGQDDMEIGKKHNLPFVQHVTFDGRFTDDVTDFKGAYVKPKDNHQVTDIEIIKHLAHAGLLFSKEKIIHSYPHCWRCDTPLLNYATSSWFINAPKLRDKMIKENKDISWVPKHIGEGRFNNLLEGAPDWSISRARFWGAPIPVWESEDGKERVVVGSIADIKKHTPHRNTFYVIRHGEAESNVQEIVSGKKDNPHHLTEKGKKQVEKSAKDLDEKDIDLIIASPFVRTMETAKIIRKELGLSKEALITDERIKEIWTGELEGKPVQEFRDFYASGIEQFKKAPEGGETLIDVRKRVMEFMYDVDKKHEGKNILIVSHGYPVWMLLTGTEGVSDNELAARKDKIKDVLVKNAELNLLDFTPIPHNEEFEFDLHRPYIDDVVLVSDSGKELKRVPEVFDCWVESGSMPFAQFHYPFENKSEFKKNFPADFIAEGLDQTRGWFYTMLTLSTGIFGKAPYKNVVVNGLVLAEDGKKLSKKLKNYSDPWDILNKYSADALRYYMLSSPIVHGEDLRFSEKGVDEVQKKVIIRLLNVASFFEMYKTEETVGSSTSKNILDKWILARLSETEEVISSALESYELDRAVRPIGEFVDDLSAWYLRRSRDRFKGKEGDEEKKQALGTTAFIMSEFAKIIAPFMPFIAEDLYQKSGGDKESVHLEDWPKMGKIDKKILEEMEEARRIVSLALEARAEAGIKVRQPLGKLFIKNTKLQIDSVLLGIILDEVNIKELDLKSVKDGNLSVVLDLTITPELKKEGQYREFVRNVQGLRKENKFTPSDMVTLTINTNDEGRELIEAFSQELKDISLLKEIVFGNTESGTEVAIGDMRFSIALEK